MAREDRWRDERRYDFRDEERRMASRPDYGQTAPDYPDYGDPRTDERARRAWEERRRMQHETHHLREQAYRPFGDSGPTAYGFGPGFIDPASGYAPLPPASYPYAESDYTRSEARYTPHPREGRGEESRSFLDRASDEVASWFGDRDAERRRRGDEVKAEHRGRGPKGYRRSDERIREDVSDRLTDDPYLDASDLEVSVVDGEVTLTGLVATREDKRRAERLAEGAPGVKDVQNTIRVRRAEAPDTY